jgi:hypothetical protein
MPRREPAQARASRTAMTRRCIQLAFSFARSGGTVSAYAVAASTRASWKRIEPLTHGFDVNGYNPEDAARLGTTSWRELRAPRGARGS